MKRLALSALIIIVTIALVLMPREQYKGFTGRASEGTATVSFGILGPCGNIFMEDGWNFVSICSNMTNKTVSAALQEISGSYRYVMEWDENTQEFMIYSPLSVVNPFNEFSINKSYFIYIVPASAEINPSGELFDDMEIPLMFGWNSPVYPYEVGSNITSYLSTIEGQYRYVMKWNSTEQRFLIYSPLAAVPEFTRISSGEGQFIYVENSSGATLKYNRSVAG